MDSSGSEEDPMAGSYERGNEPNISIKSRVTESLLAYQEGAQNLVRHVRTCEEIKCGKIDPVLNRIRRHEGV
jgi:hypothetical protein